MTPGAPAASGAGDSGQYRLFSLYGIFDQNQQQTNAHPSNGESDGGILSHKPHFLTSFIYVVSIECFWSSTVHVDCWKPPSPFSNVHFRNTTKILQHRFFTLNFLLILL